MGLDGDAVELGILVRCLEGNADRVGKWVCVGVQVCGLRVEGRAVGRLGLKDTGAARVGRLVDATVFLITPPEDEVGCPVGLGSFIGAFVGTLTEGRLLVGALVNLIGALVGWRGARVGALSKLRPFSMAITPFSMAITPFRRRQAAAVTMSGERAVHTAISTRIGD